MTLGLMGLLPGLTGTDSNTGLLRDTFGLTPLWDGIDFIVLAVGLFVLGKIYSTPANGAAPEAGSSPINRLWPGREDFRRIAAPILRGTGIGSILRVLPGAGNSMSSFISCRVEKRVSRHPEALGTGAIEGVAGPESTNNAVFIPTLTLGIPGSPVMALILGALMIRNIQPGPNVIPSRPELFRGLIASMWIGNLMLILLNLPLVGIRVKLLCVPCRPLFPGIWMFSGIGVYAAVFGVIGVGPMPEENFNRAPVLSDGSLLTFVDSVTPAAMLALVMRGERHVKRMATARYMLENRKFESTIRLRREDIEDDRRGVCSPRISRMAHAAASHPGARVFGVLKSGFTAESYGGRPFFDADHAGILEGGTGASVSAFGGGAGTPWFLLDVSRPVRPRMFQTQMHRLGADRHGPDHRTGIPRHQPCGAGGPDQRPGHRPEGALPGRGRTRATRAACRRCRPRGRHAARGPGHADSRSDPQGAGGDRGGRRHKNRHPGGARNGVRRYEAAGVGEAVDDLLVGAFVAQAAVEALDEAPRHGRRTSGGFMA